MAQHPSEDPSDIAQVQPSSTAPNSGHPPPRFLQAHWWIFIIVVLMLTIAIYFVTGSAFSILVVTLTVFVSRRHFGEFFDDLLEGLHSSIKVLQTKFLSSTRNRILAIGVVVILILGAVLVHPWLTSSPTVTPDPQNLYKQVTSSTPVFDDHLTHQDDLHWAEGRECFFAQGSYHAHDPYRKPPHATECLAQASNVSGNFVFQIKMTIVRGDKGGLLFGYGGTNSRKYRFAIDQNGDYDLFVPKLGRSLVSSSSTLITQGLNQPNVLTVMVKGNIFYLYIKGQYVTQVNVLAGTSVSGEIGLFSDLKQQTTSQSAEVVFSDVEVWML
jgi:hypothetical protein